MECNSDDFEGGWSTEEWKDKSDSVLGLDEFVKKSQVCDNEDEDQNSKFIPQSEKTTEVEELSSNNNNPSHIARLLKSKDKQRVALLTAMRCTMKSDYSNSIKEGCIEILEGIVEDRDRGIPEEAANLLARQKRELQNYHQYSQRVENFLQDKIGLNEMIRNNLTGPQVSFKGEQIQTLIEPLKENTTIEKLVVKDSILGNREVAQISEILRSNSSIRTIALAGDNIGDEGASAMVQALKSNRHIQIVDFGGDKMTDQGVEEFSSLLREHVNIQSLSLGGECIGDDGLRCIAEALKLNSGLHTLTIGGDRITDKGAKALAEAMQDNLSLRRLTLGGHQIRDVGVKELAKVIESSKTLETFAMLGGKSSDEGVLYMADAIKSSRTLQTLVLDCEGIGEDSIKSLVEALEVNNSLKRVYLNDIEIEDSEKSAIQLHFAQKGLRLEFDASEFLTSILPAFTELQN